MPGARRAGSTTPSAASTSACATARRWPASSRGGNQQKLLLAKMLLGEPRVIVVDEPTRGIDIGTKAEIYRLLARLAADGTAVVVISSEMAELIGLCHRILVMREGRIVGELAGDAMTERGSS